ncbi:hypothetical protein ACTSKR_03075 [Chitinibacteraceae bacterium HSL-7]
MKTVLAALALLLAANTWACDMAVKAQDGINASVEKMRHGTKNELSLFVKVRNTGKKPLDLDQLILPVRDDQGRVVEPERIERAQAQLGAGEEVLLVSHYKPAPDYTATQLQVGVKP